MTRPTPVVTVREPTFECLACGDRSSSGAARVCDSCGGSRVNLGVGRDL